MPSTCAQWTLNISYDSFSVRLCISDGRINMTTILMYAISHGRWFTSDKIHLPYQQCLEVRISRHSMHLFTDKANHLMTAGRNKNKSYPECVSNYHIGFTKTRFNKTVLITTSRTRINEMRFETFCQNYIQLNQNDFQFNNYLYDYEKDWAKSSTYARAPLKYHVLELYICV